MVSFGTQAPGDDSQVQKEGEAVDIRSQVKGNTKGLQNQVINICSSEALVCTDPSNNGAKQAGTQTVTPKGCNLTSRL